MSIAVVVRPVNEGNFAAWQPRWDGYNACYGREGVTALPVEITKTIWRRFFDASEPAFALVAESGGKRLGFTHDLFHRSTTRIELTCYLQDLFTTPASRGQGVGTALIEGVYQAARTAGRSTLALRNY